MQFFVLRVASNQEDRVREARGEPPEARHCCQGPGEGETL